MHPMDYPGPPAPPPQLLDYKGRIRLGTDPRQDGG